MKKTMLIAWLVVIATTCSKAQYFQKLYSDNSSAYNGMITRSTGPGHVMGGVNRLGLTSDVGLMVIRTDPDGNFINPTEFNNTYMLQNANGNILQFEYGHVVEFSDGTGYGIMGSYQYMDASGTYHGLAYIRLDINGNVMAVNGYVPNMVSHSLGLMSTFESVVTPGDIFATAHFVSNSESSYVIVLRISQNGALIWGNNYDFPTTDINFETPADIIESPYGNNEVYVVGSIYYPGFNFPPSYIPKHNGFWLSIDRNSGAPIGMQEYDGHDWERFSAINISNDPVNPGFILCGYTEHYHEGLCWVLKTDPNMNVQWSYLYSENIFGKIENIEAYDVVGRLNTLGNYEYYVTGRMEQTFMDAFIMKLDNNGIPVNPGALFVYSTGTAVAQWGCRVDVNTSGTGDGVSIYGIWDDPYATSVARRSYMVKAYFNGQSGCNETFTDIYDIPFPPTITPTPVSITAISDLNLNILSITTDNDITLCHNLSIPNGDNSFTVSVNPEIKNMTGTLLFPNPLIKEQKTLTIQVQSSLNESIQLVIVDMLGRQIYINNYHLDKGMNTLQVDISGIALEKGLYQVIIEKPSGREIIKLLVN